MADLVTDEHVIQAIAHILPAWKNQSTILEVKGSSLRLIIVNYVEILVRQEAGEN